jgi:hypothetical protein
VGSRSRERDDLASTSLFHELYSSECGLMESDYVRAESFFPMFRSDVFEAREHAV